MGAAPWLGAGGVSIEQSLLAATPSALLFTENEHSHTGQVACPICDWTESYTLQKAGSKNMATVRMKKHLKQSKTDRDKHAILYGRVAGKSVSL